MFKCIVCGIKLGHAFGSHIGDEYQSIHSFKSNKTEKIQPLFGLHCITYGHYGSAYFDPINRREMINFVVCDKCIKKAIEEDGTAIITEY